MGATFRRCPDRRRCRRQPQGHHNLRPCRRATTTAHPRMGGDLPVNPGSV